MVVQGGGWGGEGKPCVRCPKEKNPTPFGRLGQRKLRGAEKEIKGREGERGGNCSFKDFKRRISNKESKGIRGKHLR